jgi:hypothetical protein
MVLDLVVGHVEGWTAFPTGKELGILFYNRQVTAQRRLDDTPFQQS